MEHEIRALLQGATIIGVIETCGEDDVLRLDLASGHSVTITAARLRLATAPFVDDPLEGPMASLAAVRAGAKYAGVRLPGRDDSQ